jgi:pilus assembly protein CpaB
MLQGKNPLLIALALAIAAAAFAVSAIEAERRRVRKGWETTKILVAAQDIVEGTELDEEMVAIKDIPEKFVTDSYIKIPEDPAQQERLVLPFGQRVLVPLKAGDPVLLSHFETMKEFEFSSMIQKRGRAVTIDVADKASVGGWIRPKDHVDVIVTIRDPQSQEIFAVTLLQNIIVLATGRIHGNTTYVPEEERKYSNVTLLVLPEEAEILALAGEVGPITLALRNEEDLDIQEQRGRADLKTLVTGERTQQLQARRYETIQVIRGVKGSKDTPGVAQPEAP